MGLDFIRSVSGKPHTKRWAKGLDRAKSPTLLDGCFTEESRTLAVELTRPVREGDPVIVRADAAGFTVSAGLQQVGTVRNPPGCSRAALDARQGIAAAVVARVGPLGATAEIVLA